MHLATANTKNIPRIFDLESVEVTSPPIRSLNCAKGFGSVFGVIDDTAASENPTIHPYKKRNGKIMEVAGLGSKHSIPLCNNGDKLQKTILAMTVLRLIK